MKQAGLSIIEVMIAAAITVVMIFGTTTAYNQLEGAKNLSISRIRETQIASQTAQLLSAPSQCIQRLVDHTQALGTKPTIAFSATQQFDLYDDLTPGSTPAFQSGEKTSGIQYTLTLQNKVLDANIAAGVERPLPTTRYIADLQITSTKIADANASSTTIIPIMVEIDSTQKLYSCTVRPDAVDDVLGAPPGVPAHSVRDCYKVGGVPYPTKAGLVCRTAVTSLNQPSGISVVPPNINAMCPAGWAVVRSPAGIPYTTTLIRDLHMSPKCSAQTYCNTSWHSMAAVPVESCTAGRDSGGSGGANSLGASILAMGSLYSSYNLPLISSLADTAFGDALVSIGGLMTTPIGWVLLTFVVLDFLFGGSGGGCSDVYATQYAQYTGVACW